VRSRRLRAAYGYSLQFIRTYFCRRLPEPFAGKRESFQTMLKRTFRTSVSLRGLTTAKA